MKFTVGILSELPSGGNDLRLYGLKCATWMILIVIRE